MALPMAHLMAAYGWAEKYCLSALHSPEFYLGSISPDAIHSRSSTNRSDKFITHLSCKFNDYSNVEKFLEENDGMFALGYAVHIVTDRLWSSFYRDNYKGLFDGNGKVIPAVYYNDTDQVDFMLYERSSLRVFLWDMLERSVSPELNGLLTSDEIERWKHRCMRYFNSGKSTWSDPVKYLTYDVVLGFISRVPEQINEVITHCYENALH